MRIRLITTSLVLASLPGISALHAQTAMDHSRHSATMGGAAPAAAGQDAFAAIASIVAQLDADSTTDWAKVDIAALRRHLQAMHDVTLFASATQTEVAGGARMDVTGQGRVVESIRSMLHAHAPELVALRVYRATAEDIPGGVRLTVRASDPGDAKTIARIRALGFIGLLTEGAHHAEHHLMIAKGVHHHR